MQVVIADDEEISRTMVQRIVEECGFEALAAEDGEQACELLLSSDRPPLAVIDWEMPARDGLNVCQCVRQRRPLDELFVLMLTARATKNDLVRALESGASDYVSKPFDGRELKARLEVGSRLLDRAPDPGLPFPPDADSGGWLVPRFDFRSMKFTHDAPASRLRDWENEGILRKVLLDRVQLCPKCQAPPTFRFGCPCCGSGRVLAERMIHHFRCAHVGSAQEFERDDDLVCPKCRKRHLVAGTDFEYMDGPYRCLDCDWSAFDLEHIAHCLHCNFRFPARQSFVQDLVGYHASQLDPLADGAASR